MLLRCCSALACWKRTPRSRWSPSPVGRSAGPLQRACPVHLHATANRPSPLAVPIIPSSASGELDLSKVPFYEFNGEYLQLPEAPKGEAAKINGAGFCPWQYPELHEKR